MSYTKELLTTDSGTTVEGWVLDGQRWNGWAIPVFNKENALKLVNAKDFQLEYIEKTDTIQEIFNPDYFEFEDECMFWKGEFNEEIGEVVYAIGAGYYCWSEVEDK